MTCRTLFCALLLTTTTVVAPLHLPAQVRSAPRGMPAFRSDAAFRAWLRALLAERAARERLARRMQGAGGLGQAADAAAPMATATAGESITNVQHAGVDEGGIVKVHGQHLVVLRRGRLFTVRVGETDLTPVDMHDAFGPGLDPSGAWYDEMLIAGDLIAVIGYSYARGGTEVGLFRITARGRLAHQRTFQLRSNDYYSSRNYASRLIGSQLVFYAPLYLPWHAEDLDAVLPAVREWRGAEGEGAWRTLARGPRVYRPVGFRGHDDVALHTVTRCDLAAAELDCEATVVAGPAGRVFYVSADAVYVWMSSWAARTEGGRSTALLTRIPLDGGQPSAIGVEGSPVDQFSFLEADGALHVVTRDGDGEAMWSAEHQRGQVALLRLPLARLHDGGGSAPLSWYRRLPTPPGWSFQNRFVGAHLLYGAGNGWGQPADSDTTLYVVPLDGGAVRALALQHGTDRIEVMGEGAVVIGARGGNLEFSGIRLGRAPRVEQRFVMPEASQGETRSHGFFYRAEANGTGMIGLPVREARRAGARQLVEGSASLVFVRNTGRRFSEAGVLEASRVRDANDHCRASCVDWYGNARPIFLRGRIFALLGYELVEGTLAEGALREVQRVSFAPGAARFAGR